MAGIFKAYDIRGIYTPGASASATDTISPSTAWELGFLAGRSEILWPQGAILISRDMRASSGILSSWLAAGLRAGGREVVNGGLMTTPMHYWYNRRWKVAGSIQITASHNGGEYNGFKVSGAGALPIGFDNGLNSIEQLWHTAPQVPAKVENQTADPEVLAEYLAYMRSFWPEQISLRLAFDCGNGMAGYDTPRLAEMVPGLSWKGLYTELDGSFPNHAANPLDYTTLVDLQNTLRTESFDLGVAFDGDGDRAIFLAGDGSIIRPDAFTAFIAESLLAEEQGAAIVFDVRMSRAVTETIHKAGGRAVRSRVGHAYMKEVMRNEDAVFGGEVSCHFYFRELGYTDSALFAMLTGIRFFHERGINPADLNRLYSPYPKSEEINFKVANPLTAIEQVASRYPPSACNRLDGLTVEETDAWFNLRASNTEPLLRLNAEWTSPGGEVALAKYLQRLDKEIHNA